MAIVSSRQQGEGNAKAITTAEGTRMQQNLIDVLGNYAPSMHNASAKVLQIGNAIESANRDNPQRGRVYDPQGIAPALSTMQGGDQQPVVLGAIPIKNATEQGYLLAEEGDGVDISTRMQHHRGTVQKGMTQTLTTAGGTERGVVIDDLRIRKLTMRECWRLMGRTDDDFEKAEKVCSNSQLYKQAGNSIVVDVLVYLFGELFRQYPTERNENG
jgi:DNA (cytosine-5)-methyltransferase 1